MLELVRVPSLTFRIDLFLFRTISVTRYPENLKIFQISTLLGRGCCRLNLRRYISSFEKKEKKKEKKSSARRSKKRKRKKKRIERRMRRGKRNRRKTAFTVHSSKYSHGWLHLWSNCGQMTASQYRVLSKIVERRGGREKENIKEETEGRREKKKKKTVVAPSQVTNLVKTRAAADRNFWGAVANRELSPRRVES